MTRFFALIAVFAAMLTPASAKTDIETEFAAQIAESEMLGRIIYDYDMAAWVATDQLVDQVGDLRGKITGWIVEDSERGERVLFYRGSNGLFAPAYSIEVRQGKAAASTFKSYSESEALTPAQAAMIKARELGLMTGTSGCAKSYNTVVIRDDAAGFLVYILAATTDLDTVQFGGHLRHDIDSAGENVVGFRKFTNTCIALKKLPPSGNELVALMISQVLTPYPTEIHVWASLLHDIDIFVVTGERQMWKVSGGKIEDASSILTASSSNVSFMPSRADWSILRSYETGGIFEPGLP